MKISAMRIEPMQPTRNGQEVASILRAQIQSGELAVGTRLPSQRELAAMLGIGRPSLREGLAHLEAEGYLVTRRGATGGSFVSEPSTPPSVWIELLRTNLPDLEDLLDFRIGIERRIAGLAAERRSEADLARMQAAIDVLPAGESPTTAFRAADAQFHGAVARAAGNRRLEEASRLARADLFMPTDNAPFEHQIEITRVQHQQIADAVRDRDVEAAMRVTTEHIEQTRQHLLLLVSQT